MYYENYLSGLKKSAVEVRKAVKSGAILSRLEKFDYEFKRELAILEGLRGKRGALHRVLSSISDSDYRLACFYAKGFSDIQKVIENGYTFNGVAKQFKSYIKVAELRFLCATPVMCEVTDLNGKITVLVATESSERTYEISSIEDYVMAVLYLLSLIGSMGEENVEYKAWFKNYLIDEFRKVLGGVKAGVFVERESVSKDLKSHIVDSGVRGLDRGKVIHLAK